MQDNFLNHNFDKLLLFVLTLLTGSIVIHIIHHQTVDQSAMPWAENAFSTVLGALILILTGRIQRSDGQTANGQPPTPSSTTTISQTTVEPPAKLGTPNA